MFHSEFYPTPPNAIELMNLDCKDKIILEPHAGKGDLMDYFYKHGAKEVLAFEINEDLQKVVRQKGKLIGSDFFNCQPEDINHVHAIYMNPPFSNAERHIMHAWQVAPEGCEIVSLCNWQTLDLIQRFPRLKAIASQYGQIENLGDCFNTAERKTGIDIGLIRLFKPIESKNFEYEGFFMDNEEEEEQGEGMMQYNEVRALVNRYVYTMKSFDEMIKRVNDMNNITKDIGMTSIKLEVGYNESITDKKSFSKLVQKQSWKHIFNKMKLEKYVTSGVMADINKFVEIQEKVPFTMKNIYKMLQIIVGTRQQTFDRALEEAIDNFTKHTHENRFGVSGWKTNTGHMLNKKFIVENIVGFEYSQNISVKYDTFGERKINDLTKVLCNITATDYNSVGSLYRFNYNTSTHEKIFTLETNTWYDWGFFEIKFFKKGTMHVKFKTTEDWYRLNKAYGELKGFSLPENYKKSA
jgi:hypothetical protein